MASIQSKVFNILLRLANKKGSLKQQFANGNFNAFTVPAPPAGLRKACYVDNDKVNGHTVFTLRHRHHRGKKHILYLHGGAYVTGFVALHWIFIKQLIAHTKCSITAPDYPLAPAHSYKEVFEMLVKLYRRLLLTVHPDDLILMGDSAGGGLALALAQKTMTENLAQPGHIILLSPWLDLTLSNPEIAAIDPIDPFIGIEGLRLAAKAYAGGDNPNHYLLSPINGPLDGLGKVSVFIGTKEILVADARKLKNLMLEKGISINYHEYKDMTHVWMLLPFPESRRAKDEIIGLIRSDA